MTTNELIEPAEPTGPPLLARVFPLSTQILTALAVVISVACLIIAAGDAEGDVWWSSGFMWAAAIPTAWSVLQPLWRPDPVVPVIFAAMQRTIVMPIIVAPIIAIVNSVVILLPPVDQLIRTSARPDGWHYYFPADDGLPLFHTLVLGGLAGMIISMLLGLALSVAVVLPWVAFRRPREFAASNQLDTSEASAKNNNIAGKFFAIMIILVFLVPGFIIFGSRNSTASSISQLWTTWPLFFSDPEHYWGDAMWMAGLALIPVGIITVIVVRLKQRPDHDARAASGTAARGDGPQE